jgi:ribosome maturation protein SDO1
VADKERKMEYENLFKDVAGVLAEKCVNPDTHRPYTITVLERALRDVHFNLDPKKAAKQQALEVCVCGSVEVCGGGGVDD